MQVTFFLAMMFVGSREKYTPPDTAEVCCNTYLNKLPTKPKKRSFYPVCLDSFSGNKLMSLDDVAKFKNIRKIINDKKYY